jgi:DNA repair protein RecO (recombination protein O)
MSPPVETAATVLTTIAYGESSRIARLATRELGVVSAIAKGARAPKSKFGAALQVLSGGQATIYLARASDLHTLSAFDVVAVRHALAASVERYATASVLGELMLRFAPHERQVELYEFFAHSLAVLEQVPADAVETVGLRAIWGLIKRLGFAPTLTACARDGSPARLQNGTVAFSPAHGGVLCSSCARGVETSRLADRDLADLEILIHGHDDLPVLDGRHLAAHRRLLERYLRYHLAEGLALPALAFWSEPTWRKVGTS